MPNDLHTALSNASTLNWLGAQGLELKTEIRLAYAKHLSCPFDEVPSFFRPEDLTNEDLSWLHSQFRIDIGEYNAIGNQRWHAKD